ncbi:MAG: response regulator [Thermodesulfobacteriota bacterium]|nr:response regulator [Thermodesulfobacteriota bacterium]
MGSTKIMVVEDNATVAEDCRDCLQSLGYSVTSIVASGEESIERAEAERPDAVLMDIHLRDEIDGIEAAEQIHSRFEIPVVFLSAYSDRELLERAKRVGSFGYLLKPFDERELYATLEMALYKAKAEKGRRQMEARLRQAQKMEAIGSLAGGIAHQFNNALFGITGNIDLLEMGFPGDESVAKYTRQMKISARRMTQLTAKLLAYARGGKYQVKTISLSDFVKETLTLVRHTIDPAIHVDTDLPCGILDVNADLSQMQMVLTAVLANASEAMGGKGHIRVACGNEMVTDEAAEGFPGLKSGNYACLTIADDGKGMDEETSKRIFEPFFTTSFTGRGLGMAAVYGIVKNHDGWIGVDSELGKGTTVKIYLPAIGSVQARPAVLPAEEVPVKDEVKLETEWNKGTGTILVIEDEEPVMKVTRAILERLGYSVLEAKTGQEAIDVVKTFDGDIDLAMLDILLPDMSGNAIYPFLMDARPDLKVIVFSGYSIDGPAQEILDAGAQDFIQKPFAIAELSEKLKKILEK